mgnify:CR=1 FL=1
MVQAALAVHGQHVLGQIVGSEREKPRFLRDLTRHECGARQYEHGADEVFDLAPFLREDLACDAIVVSAQIESDLVDLEPDDPLIVFVEVVATDGAVTTRRHDALLAITEAAGFRRSRVAFVTAYADRQSAGFRRTVSQLAWGTFAWFASEPEHIMAMHDGIALRARLADLLRS